MTVISIGSLDRLYNYTNRHTTLTVTRFLLQPEADAQTMQHHSSHNTKSPAVAMVGQLYCLYLKTSIRLPVTKRMWFPRVATVLYMLW